MSRSNYSPTLALAVLAGAAVGAGLALAYAPQVGRKTRKDLQDLNDEVTERAQALLDRAGSGLERAGKKGQDWIDKGHRLVDEKKRQFTEVTSGL